MILKTGTNLIEDTCLLAHEEEGQLQTSQNWNGKSYIISFFLYIFFSIVLALKVAVDLNLYKLQGMHDHWVCSRIFMFSTLQFVVTCPLHRVLENTARYILKNVT